MEPSPSQTLRRGLRGRKEFIEKLKSGKGLTKEDYITVIRDFVIAATAKDCSIMTAFLPLDDGETCEYPIVQDATGKRYGYRVAVVDLDPKPLANMEYWYKSDTKIVHNFLASVGDQLKPGKKEDSASSVLPRCYKE